MFKRHLMSSGAQILRAPEDDHGGGFDPNDLEDFNFDDPDQDDDDDDQDDGDHGEDVNDDIDDEPPARQERKPSRASQRIQALERERATERERAERLEREMQELRSGRTQTSQAELDRAERELMATMSSDERIEYRLEKSQRLTEQRLNALALQSADAADRASFEARCIGNKTLGSLKDKVEEAVAKARAQGSTADRMSIAKYLIGELMMEKGAKAGTKQRRQAVDNRNREQSRPGAARSDARTSGGKMTDRAARAKRLDGQAI